MSRKLMLCCLMIAAFAALGIIPAAAQDTLKIGMLLVGPKNDGGWSQAHYDAGVYVAKNVPGVEFLEPLENINAGNPDITTEAAAKSLIDAGAKIIFMTSDAETGAAPGRVLSPPTSMRSAPSAIIA